MDFVYYDVWYSVRKLFNECWNIFHSPCMSHPDHLCWAESCVCAGKRPIPFVLIPSKILSLYFNIYTYTNLGAELSLGPPFNYLTRDYYNGFIYDLEMAKLAQARQCLNLADLSRHIIPVVIIPSKVFKSSFSLIEKILSLGTIEIRRCNTHDAECATL